MGLGMTRRVQPGGAGLGGRAGFWGDLLDNEGFGELEQSGGIGLAVLW